MRLGSKCEQRPTKREKLQVPLGGWLLGSLLRGGHGEERATVVGAWLELRPLGVTSTDNREHPVWEAGLLLAAFGSASRMKVPSNELS